MPLIFRAGSTVAGQEDLASTQTAQDELAAKKAGKSIRT
jgi:hypothetical protein